MTYLHSLSRSTRRLRQPVALATSIAMLVLSGGAQAVDTIFTNTNGDWFVGGNWDNGVPTTADIGFVMTGRTASINGPGAVATSVAVYGGTLNVGTGGTLVASTGLFVGRGDSVVNVSGAGASIDGGTIIRLGIDSDVSTLNISNGGTVRGRLEMTEGAAATGIVNLNSGGTLEMSGASAITAGDGTANFNFAGGTIRATSATSTSQNMTVTGTTSTVDTNGFTTTLFGNLTGSGALTKTGTGTLVLAGTNTYADGTTISTGTLQVGNGSTAGSITGNVTNNATLAFNRTDAVDFGGNISGSGSVVKNGSGTLTLSGTNTYLGGTTINSGRVVAATDTNLGDGAVTFAGAGGELLVDGSTFSTSKGINVSAGSTGRLSNSNTGSAAVFGGALDLQGGVLAVGSAGNAGVVTVSTTSGSASGANAVNVDFGTLRYGSTQTAALLGSISGATTVAANAALDVNGFTATIVNLQGAGTVTNDGGAAATVSVQQGNFSGNIKDGVSTTAITKTTVDTLTLTGASTYTGGTTIDAGTLLANNTTGSATGTGAVAVSNSGTLAGSGTVTGPVTLNSGGTITPGATATGISIGTVTTGALTWNGGGTVSLQLGVDNAASDLLAIDGSLTKGTAGTYLINVEDAGGFGSQQFYTLATFAGTTFLATDFTLSPLPAGFTGTFIVNANSLELRLAVALQGTTIQNVGGPNTPTFADFTATGAASTAGPTDSNTVNSLAFTPGSSLQIYNTLTVTSGNVSDQGAGQTNINGGTLAGPSGLNFNVNGTMNVTSTLQGNLVKTGAGSLYLNGTVIGSAQVLAGLLGGNAIINGSLTNNGVVSPGNSPGTIQVSQDYTQTRNGTLRIEIGGREAGQYDQLIVGGRANLDGTLELVRLNRFQLKRGDKITFLTANGGVNGEFSSATNPFSSNTILQSEVVYDDNAVSVEMVRGSFDRYAENWELTPNQRAVAKALDSVSADDVNHKALVYLDQRALSRLPGDFDKIAPEELTSIFTASTSMAQVQGTNLQRRTDDIRSGANGFTAAGLAVNGQTPGYSGDFGIRTGAAGPSGDAKESKEVKTVVADEKRWGAFLSGTGEWVDVSGDGNARGFDITTGGFTLGLDYKVTSNFAIGLAAGYAGTSADLTDNGRVWVNGGKLGLYSTYFTGGFYVDAAVTGGYNSYDTKRSALQGSARGSTEGGELNVLVGTGYDWKIGALSIGPTVTFNYTLVGMDGFTEHGSLAPLEIGQRNAESVRSAFGFRASCDWKVGGMVVKPELRAAWQHEYGDKSYDLSASFAGGAGDRFFVNGPEMGRDSLLIGAGFAVQFSETVSTFFYYDGELARENYERHSVTGGVRVAF